jgi:Glycine rich protein
MLLALAVSVPAAHAQRFEFDYTGSLITFTVPINGTYQIIAFGAQGGGNLAGAPGGLGAEIGGDFTLMQGEMLRIAVGGAGGNQNRFIGL